MIAIRPINKNNPKNIYCDYCEYYKQAAEGYLCFPVYYCRCEGSLHFNAVRNYWNRYKCFTWKANAYVDNENVKSNIEVINKMVKLYKKKPVVVEAMQFTRDSWDELVSFTNGKATAFNKSLILEDTFICSINTLEGPMTATEGDYIIRGIKGEFYPCKPDIFWNTYDAVE